MPSIKSDEEVELLLNHKNNALIKNGVKVKVIGAGNHGNGGNHNGNNTTRSVEDKATIAVTAELIGGKNTSELLGVSESVVSRFRNGKTASDASDPNLREKIEEKLEGVRKKVVDKVDMLLDIFAEDKMLELDGKDIPSAVERLIGTYDKVNRRNEKNDGIQKPQVILWAPKQINIDQYITKEVE